MSTNSTYLSPNGQQVTQGDGPVLELMVGTTEGVLTLSRAKVGMPWFISARSLTHCHIGQLLFEKKSPTNRCTCSRKNWISGNFSTSSSRIRTGKRRIPIERRTCIENSDILIHYRELQMMNSLLMQKGTQFCNRETKPRMKMA